jgi:hypothetical protein
MGLKQSSSQMTGYRVFQTSSNPLKQIRSESKGVGMIARGGRSDS